MLAFEKEDQSKSQNNNISSVQFMFVFNLLRSLFFVKKKVTINDNRSLQCHPKLPKTLRLTKQAILSKMGATFAIGF